MSMSRLSSVSRITAVTAVCALVALTACSSSHDRASTITAYDAATGTVRWTAHVPATSVDAVRMAGPRLGVDALVDKRPCEAQEGVITLNPGTGKTVNVSLRPAAHGYLHTTAQAGQLGVTLGLDPATGDGVLRAIDVPSGRVRWQEPVHQPYPLGPDVVSPSVVAVLAHGRNVAPHHHTYEIDVLDAKTGHRLWQVELPRGPLYRTGFTPQHIVAVDATAVYVVDGRSIVAHERRTGRVLWVRRTPDAASVTAAGNHVVVSESDARLRTGRLVTFTPAGGPGWASGSIAPFSWLTATGDTVYLVTPSYANSGCGE